MKRKTHKKRRKSHRGRRRRTRGRRRRRRRGAGTGPPTHIVVGPGRIVPAPPPPPLAPFPNPAAPLPNPAAPGKGKAAPPAEQKKRPKSARKTTGGTRRRRRRRSRRRRTKRRFGGQRDCLRICNDEIKKERVAWLNHYINRKNQQRNTLLASVNEGGLGAEVDDPRVAAIDGQLIRARAAMTDQELIRWAKGPTGDGVGGALGPMCGRRLDDGRVVGKCSNENFNYHHRPPQDNWNPFAGVVARRLFGPPAAGRIGRFGRFPPALPPGMVAPGVWARPPGGGGGEGGGDQARGHAGGPPGLGLDWEAAPWLRGRDGGGGGGRERAARGVWDIEDAAAVPPRPGLVRQVAGPGPADAMAQHDRAGAL